MVRLADGTVLAQTAAIMCALGKALGLDGATASEEAHAMMVTLNVQVCTPTPLHPCSAPAS